MRDSGVDKVGSNFSFGLAHIRMPEEKLAIQIGYVDRVHVDDVNLTESHQSQVFEQLASETSSPYYKNLYSTKK